MHASNRHQGDRFADRGDEDAVHFCSGGKSWLLNGENLATRITTKPTPASRWQWLQASVSFPKALAKSLPFLPSVALATSASGARFPP
jgi:hypothetical protein